MDLPGMGFLYGGPWTRLSFIMIGEHETRRLTRRDLGYCLAARLFSQPSIFSMLCRLGNILLFNAFGVLSLDNSY